MYRHKINQLFNKQQILAQNLVHHIIKFFFFLNFCFLWHNKINLTSVYAIKTCDVVGLIITDNI